MEGEGDGGGGWDLLWPYFVNQVREFVILQKLSKWQVNTSTKKLFQLKKYKTCSKNNKLNNANVVTNVVACW